MFYSYGVGLALQGIYFVLLARGLGAAQLGRFAGTLAIVDVVTPLVGLGSGNVLVKEVAIDRSQFGRHFGSSLSYIGLSAVAIAGPAVLIIGIVSPHLVVFLVPLVCAEFLGARLLELSLQVFQAFDRLHITAHLFVAAALARCIVIVTFVSLGESGSTSWAWFYMAATMTTGAIGIGLVTQLYGLPARSDLKVLPVWREGLGFAVGQGSKTVYADIDKFMLMNSGRLAVAGAFTAAYRVVTFAFVPVQALVYSSNTTMFRTGSAGPSESWKLVKRLGKIVFWCSMSACIALVVGSRLLPLILGGGYRLSAPMLLMLSGLPAIQAAHYLLGDCLMGLGRQARRGVVQVAVAGFNAGANAILIPRYSWRGAVWATYLGEGGMAVLFLYWLWRLARRDSDARATPTVKTW